MSAHPTPAALRNTGNTAHANGTISLLAVRVYGTLKMEHLAKMRGSVYTWQSRQDGDRI